MCAKLEARGIRCWIAPRDVLPGTEWAGAIGQAIEQAKVMVLVLSVDSNCSQQTTREVAHAVEAGLVVIPFRIEDVTLSDSMAYYLRVTHWLDALTPPLEQHLQRLCEAVRHNLPNVDSPRDRMPDAGSNATSSPAPLAIDSREMEGYHDSKTRYKIVSSATYGLRALDQDGQERFFPIITKNEPLPVEVNETFWTAQDGQAEFCLAIYEHMGREGHSNVELSNTVKVRDVIHPLPPGLPKKQKLDVCFALSLSGILEIRTQIELNGRSAEVGRFRVSDDSTLD